MKREMYLQLYMYTPNFLKINMKIIVLFPDLLPLFPTKDSISHATYESYEMAKKSNFMVYRKRGKISLIQDIFKLNT